LIVDDQNPDLKSGDKNGSGSSCGYGYGKGDEDGY